MTVAKSVLLAEPTRAGLLLLLLHAACMDDAMYHAGWPTLSTAQPRPEHQAWHAAGAELQRCMIRVRARNENVHLRAQPICAILRWRAECTKSRPMDAAGMLLMCAVALLGRQTAKMNRGYVDWSTFRKYHPRSAVTTYWMGVIHLDHWPHK
jgi:hypothetical protein